VSRVDAELELFWTSVHQISLPQFSLHPRQHPTLPDALLLVVTRLDRLARSTRDLLDVAERLRDAGAGLRSLAEPWADTTSPAGRMVLTVFAGIAEFERALILSRTSAGRAAAQQNGVRFGRPPALAPDQVALGRKLVGLDPTLVSPAATSEQFKFKLGLPLDLSVKRSMTGHPGCVRQSWHRHEKTDTLVAGRENGQGPPWRTSAMRG